MIISAVIGFILYIPVGLILEFFIRRRKSKLDIQRSTFQKEVKHQGHCVQILGCVLALVFILGTVVGINLITMDLTKHEVNEWITAFIAVLIYDLVLHQTLFALLQTYAVKKKIAGKRCCNCFILTSVQEGIDAEFHIPNSS
jgi:hypothetical protein